MSVAIIQLQNIDSDVYEHLVEFHGADVAREVREVWYAGDNVEVLSEETDGFWNIKLPNIYGELDSNGTIVEGISWFHLKGFKETTTTKTVTLTELVY